MQENGQRLDKWLFFCRIVKSRSLAQSLIEQGHVRVNRIRAQKPAQNIKPGDILTLAIHDEVRVLRVLSPGLRRGPASEAQGLYERVTSPPDAC